MAKVIMGSGAGFSGFSYIERTSVGGMSYTSFTQVKPYRGPLIRHFHNFEGLAQFLRGMQFAAMYGIDKVNIAGIATLPGKDLFINPYSWGIMLSHLPAGELMNVRRRISLLLDDGQLVPAEPAGPTNCIIYSSVSKVILIGGFTFTSSTYSTIPGQPAIEIPVQRGTPKLYVSLVPCNPNALPTPNALSMIYPLSVANYVGRSIMRGDAKIPLYHPNGFGLVGPEGTLSTYYKLTSELPSLVHQIIQTGQPFLESLLRTIKRVIKIESPEERSHAVATSLVAAALDFALSDIDDEAYDAILTDGSKYELMRNQAMSKITTGSAVRMTASIAKMNPIISSGVVTEEGTVSIDVSDAYSGKPYDAMNDDEVVDSKEEDDDEAEYNG